MADRAISALPTATTLTATDLFVLSQSNQAKNTTWQTIIGYLTTALDGHGGIQSIVKTGTSGLVDTYTMTFADQTTQTFTVTNGKSTSGITQYWAVSDSDTTVPSSWSTTRQTMTATDRYLWSYYTFAFNDGTTLDTTKAVVGVYGDTGQDWHVYIRWSETEPTSDADISTTPNNWIGIYSGTAATAPTSYSDYEWFEYKGEKGDTGNGITGISLYSSSGLVDTYRVYFDDGTYTSFDVTNGAQIDRIEKTSTSGLTDTYTVYLTNGTSATTFNVTNGKGISSITEVDVTHAAGHTDVYRFNFNDGDTYTFSIYNGSNGSGSVSTVDNIPSNNQNVPLLTLGQGAPTTATVGQLKSRYFDQTNSILYICVGIDTSGSETTYTWQGAGVTVDSALSTMSTNPVQNAVLTALLGTATLETTAQTLTGAVNELNSGKVSKSGDTMTGPLNVNDADIALYNTQYASEDTPSTTQSMGFALRDKNGHFVGYASSFISSALSGLQLRGYSYATGSPVFNQIGLYVDKQGNLSVNLTSPAAWRNALGLGTDGEFPITVAQGGTGATDAEAAVANLGLGTLQAEKINIANGASGEFSIPNTSRGLIICSGSNSGTKELILYNCTSTGAVTYAKVGMSTGITITTATNKITITNNGGSATQACKISF